MPLIAADVFGTKNRCDKHQENAPNGPLTGASLIIPVINEDEGSNVDVK